MLESVKQFILEHFHLQGAAVSVDCDFITPTVNGEAPRLRSKIISSTRAVDGATADVAYTGVGFKPTSIHARCHADGSGYKSDGFSDSAKTSACSYMNPTTAYHAGTLCTYSNQAAWAQNAVVKSYDDDGFTLTWTKVGASPAGTLKLDFLCER